MVSSTRLVDDTDSVLAWLRRTGTQKQRDSMARYAIVAPRAFGVSVGDLKKYARSVVRRHDLALALWDTGWYEARMLACFVDIPAEVSPAQMDRWCRDFDNWAVCDHACFHLFDRTPHAWRKVRTWSARKGEFQKRAAFALLAAMALHDKHADDALFIDALPLVEAAATDDRNFVKKGVSWALRGIAHRSAACSKAAARVARRLAESPDPAARWVGRDFKPRA